ncbi:cupin domain-containing protein [Haloplanus halobius]|uniref:cupin domain-containing protein n=1 Tax=Haloplanus halobius TaxID=2934938 RepID=UPI00200F7B3B|nr:cupin domain-containing protein [Haloplanus sp. XH21]
MAERPAMRVNDADLDWTTVDRGETGFRRKKLAAAAGGERLGCSLYELPPGKQSWPFHYHTGNEEAIYVLSGTGQLRTADGTDPLRGGDYAVFPTGEDGGHRVINDGDDPLRYLAVSTMRDPDVTVYPDSGKIGVYAGSPPGSDADRTVSGYFRRDDDVDYWTDEP